MHIKMKRTILVLLSILFAVQACKKIENIAYEKEDLNKITSFKISNTSQELYGAIDQTMGIITVYIPYYLSLDYLTPIITVDEGATVYDQNGNLLVLNEDLEPIKIDTDITIKYTVKSSTGTAKSYTIVQVITPYKDPLSVKVSGVDDVATLLEKPVYSLITLVGNFESVSKNAQFIFTNRQTGVVYHDFATVNSITPGNEYTMIATISPEALAGEYDVKLVHQGRSVNINPIKLYYQAYSAYIWPSTTSYAPGDTLTFSASPGTNSAFVNGDIYAGVFVGVKSAYVKIYKATTTVSLNSGETLDDSWYDRPIEMKIAGYTRTNLKLIVPELPAGAYLSKYIYPNIYGNHYGFAFYADFDEQTTAGTDFFIGRGATISPGFTIKAK